MGAITVQDVAVVLSDKIKGKRTSKKYVSSVLDKKQKLETIFKNEPCM